MDIDVQGAAQVRERVGELPFDHVLRSGFVDVFILPPSIDELRRRLVVRGEDSPDVIETRLRNAKAEMREQGCYAYRVVNTDIDEAFRELVSILETEETRRRGA